MNPRIGDYALLYDLVEVFSKEMKIKLAYSTFEKQRSGWDDYTWTKEEMVKDLINHLEKGDMIDVANIALFIWHRNQIEL